MENESKTGSGEGVEETTPTIEDLQEELSRLEKRFDALKATDVIDELKKEHYLWPIKKAGVLSFLGGFFALLIALGFIGHEIGIAAYKTWLGDEFKELDKRSKAVVDGMEMYGIAAEGETLRFTKPIVLTGDSKHRVLLTPSSLSFYLDASDKSRRIYLHSDVPLPSGTAGDNYSVFELASEEGQEREKKRLEIRSSGGINGNVNPIVAKQRRI